MIGEGGERTDQQKEEHGEGDEDVDGQGHLLARLGGQVEDEHGEEGDAHAGEHQVHRVEEGFAPEGQVELNENKWGGGRGERAGGHEPAGSESDRYGAGPYIHFLVDTVFGSQELLRALCRLG